MFLTRVLHNVSRKIWVFAARPNPTRPHHALESPIAQESHVWSTAVFFDEYHLGVTVVWYGHLLHIYWHIYNNIHNTVAFKRWGEYGGWVMLGILYIAGNRRRIRMGEKEWGYVTERDTTLRQCRSWHGARANLGVLWMPPPKIIPSITAQRLDRLG